ncbi:MAG: response regulator [Clostridiaceae bacterium]|nr:response regulator [Clostridiaceae bacterium]
MIRIAAVDDELHILKWFERIALKIDGLEICGLYQSGEALISYLRHHAVDAVFLDVEIGNENGMDLYEQIMQIDENIEIIFVTAYNKYAVEAFELQALDYLLKPITSERLEKTIIRLMNSPKIAQKPERPYIQCFGDFQLLIHGTPVTWKNSKAKEILAFLVSKEGAPMGWEKIVDAIWPDFAPEQAHANFHATNYLLRKRLGELGCSDIIDSTPGNYRILRDTIECDVYIFQDFIRKSLSSELSQTEIDKIRLMYQGQFMENEPYSWAIPKAVSLEKAYIRMTGALR